MLGLRLREGVAILLGTLALIACTPQPPAPYQGSTMGVGGSPYKPPSQAPPEMIDNDAGLLIGSRPRDGGAYEAGPRSRPDSGPPPEQDASGGDAPGDDASMDSGIGADDAAATGPCPGPLGAGDLAVVELMIASQSGPGDMGQWIEVQSTRDCTLDLNGLHAVGGTAASPATLDITSDVYLPPNGIFVIANSLDPTLNDELPTTPLLLGWAGAPADVLQTAGGTITLSNGATGTVVDDLTYPELQTLIVGTSISFPADCAWSDRTDWTRWSLSTNFWFSLYQGTPNAPNTDVTCY
jgi:hypothetical protein